MNAIPHDFRKPCKLSGDWPQKLTVWARQAFDQANKTWAKQLPFSVEGSLLDVDVRYGKDSLSTLPEDIAGYRILLADRQVTTFLCLPRSTLLKLVGAMLGDNDSTDTKREMTLIEENLADYFLVHYWLPFFREAWPGTKLASWELQPREKNPQCLRLFADSDVLITWNWLLRGPWGECTGTWFFHKNSLFESLGDRSRLASESMPETQLKSCREAIVTMLPLTVEVVVGTAELKLSQLSQLQIGDVVLLNLRDENSIVARAGGRDLFRGKAGRLGSSKALQIEAINES